MKYNLSSDNTYECDTDGGDDEKPKQQSVLMLCLAPKVTDEFEE